MKAIVDMPSMQKVAALSKDHEVYNDEDDMSNYKNVQYKCIKIYAEKGFFDAGKCVWSYFMKEACNFNERLDVKKQR